MVPKHVSGDGNPEVFASALARGNVDGVLTQYKVFAEEVG